MSIKDFKHTTVVSIPVPPLVVVVAAVVVVVAAVVVVVVVDVLDVEVVPPCPSSDFIVEIKG